MNIAILGATSQIAKDLIKSFSNKTDYKCSLFARNPILVADWLKNNNINEAYEALNYSEFYSNKKFDMVINFVGVGDPARAKEIGSEIFEVTYQYDMMVLEYLIKHPTTKYIFLSSGAVFGGNFENPVTKNTVASFPINNLNAENWYAISKFYAEARHRALTDCSIVDIRVFNYFSHTQDINARFLITDVIRTFKKDEVFITSPENIVRDFLTPSDFFLLIRAVINFKSINLAVDCYTKAPIDKFTLLPVLGDKFGLNYDVSKQEKTFNATGAKINYYSLNRVAQDIGYIPEKSSQEGIIEEIGLMQID